MRRTLFHCLLTTLGVFLLPVFQLDRCGCSCSLNLSLIPFLLAYNFHLRVISFCLQKLSLLEYEIYSQQLIFFFLICLLNFKNSVFVPESLCCTLIISLFNYFY